MYMLSLNDMIWESPVNKVTCNGLHKWCSNPARDRKFSLSPFPNKLWDTISILTSEYRELFLSTEVKSILYILNFMFLCIKAKGTRF